MHEIRNAVHLCTDMQNIFAPGGLWATPWMTKVLPAIEAVAARYPERTIFTRFIPPLHPEDRPGRWRHYFKRWERATRAHLRGSELDLVPALARYAPPALVVDKPAYSAFARSGLYELLVGKGIETVVLTGAETDVCVLSTALSAVDFGFHVVIVEDALCSSSDEGHDALMTMYRMRMHEQIDLLTVPELFDLWPQE